MIAGMIRYQIDPFQRGRASFASAEEGRFILRDERSFVELVDGTPERPLPPAPGRRPTQDAG